MDSAAVDSVKEANVVAETVDFADNEFVVESDCLDLEMNRPRESLGPSPRASVLSVRSVD